MPEAEKTFLYTKCQATQPFNIEKLSKFVE
jgi:hypothetical protein